MLYNYTMEHYSAIKRNEVLLQAATQMNLENIMLGGISQSQKDKYLCFLLYEVPSHKGRNTKQNTGYQGWFESGEDMGAI